MLIVLNYKLIDSKSLGHETGHEMEEVLGHVSEIGHSHAQKHTDFLFRDLLEDKAFVFSDEELRAALSSTVLAPA